MAVPHRRHRTPLESVIVPEPQHLTAEEHGKATELFNTIIHYFEPLQESTKEYNPITLVRLTKEEISVKDEFLLLFFTFIECDRLGISEDEQKEICLAETLSNMQNFQSWTNEERHALDHSLVKFAMYLIDNFFLPLKASTAKTPQPSRFMLSELAFGTPRRIADLRHFCLVRDRYRCVITRKFDAVEGEVRYKIYGDQVTDDDGNSLLPESRNMAFLEVAHIIPHSLMSLSNIEGELKLTEQKQIAHKILKMFNPIAFHLIQGTDIDRPMNALTLTQELHRLFGNFEVAFEPVQNEEHTYRINFMKTNRIWRAYDLPVTRELFITPDRSIEPPLRELLEIHRAIARILHLSAAGEYIDRVIQDMEKLKVEPVSSDGSSRIGDYINYKLAHQLDWTNIGQAMRLAMAHGMHTRMPVGQLGSLAVDRCRRIWWTVYILDRNMSSIQGLPLSVDDRFVWTSLPSSPRSSKKDAALDMHIKLCRSMADINSTVYGVDGRINSRFLLSTKAALSNLAGHADKLCEDFSLNLDGSCQGISRTSAYLHLLYQQGLKSQGLLETFLNFDLEPLFIPTVVLLVGPVIDPRLTDDHVWWVEKAYSIFQEMVEVTNQVAKFRWLELQQLDKTLNGIPLSQSTMPTTSTAPRPSHAAQLFSPASSYIPPSMDPTAYNDVPFTDDTTLEAECGLGPSLSTAEMMAMADSIELYDAEWVSSAMLNHDIW
ncbi:hypothetical protein BDV25DRAFT_138866 [Aspergillus avenaceus]|uniref:Xylanolytic transcriptional activator regulatory domain-containing protein n=1 Tax=Aspergillus avenaceus TaxID=36643 RepID=A0A5N6TYJ8_ASPAV|nr:hypothetical protein BDV25DRAFT_138866 [Aspergillus avenaceus]